MVGRVKKPKKKPADHTVKMKNGPNMKTGPKPEAKKPPKGAKGMALPFGGKKKKPK
jgi:hypothetical protein